MDILERIRQIDEFVDKTFAKGAGRINNRLFLHVVAGLEEAAQKGMPGLKLEIDWPVLFGEVATAHDRYERL